MIRNDAIIQKLKDVGTGKITSQKQIQDICNDAADELEEVFYKLTILFNMVYRNNGG